MIENFICPFCSKEMDSFLNDAYYGVWTTRCNFCKYEINFKTRDKAVEVFSKIGWNKIKSSDDLPTDNGNFVLKFDFESAREEEIYPPRYAVASYSTQYGWANIPKSWVCYIESYKKLD